MNIYFLVEGKRCEKKLYPAWLSVIAPHLERIYDPHKADKNCYILFSGEGYPSILDKHLPNAIRDVEDVGRFDYLVVVLDSDDDTAEARKQAVVAAVARSATRLTSATLEVVVQHRCIETWLLGNRRIFVRTPQSPDLRSYIDHYDVRQKDPEEMPQLDGFINHAQFHYAYLKAIFAERNTSYTKSRPGDAATPGYIEQLSSRVKDQPEHMKSFSRFLRICEKFSG